MYLDLLWKNSRNLFFQVSYKLNYEPYIVGTKQDLPLYNTSFLGRVQDKVSHLLMIAALQLVTINDVLIQ